MTIQESPANTAMYDNLAAALDDLHDARLATKANETVDGLAQGKRVSFILPAYNEEASVIRMIKKTASVATRHCAAYEIVVVDDGSFDRTAELVERAARGNACVRLVRHAANRGYGEALRTGFANAQFDFVFFTDSDNQFDMDEFPLLLAWAEEADVVAGFRKVRRDPLQRRINAWAWNRLVRFLFYVPVRDIDCAFKLFRRDALTQVTIESRGAMINTEIMVKLARAGYKIVEVPVTHLPRTAGDASGANVRVIMRAFREVKHMYARLADLTPADSRRTHTLHGVAANTELPATLEPTAGT